MGTLEDFRKTGDNRVISGSAHTCRVLNHKTRNRIIINAVCQLRKLNDTYDSIACSGTSGLMVVPQIAELLNKEIVIVRKKNEKSYSPFHIEGVTPFRYIIIDDLVCSGNTIKHITKSLKEEYPRSKCIGLYCYIPEDCAYTTQTSKMFERDFGMPFLNPCEPRA
jgi:adenine/guanine phosphoribosyltransferase-like PRPP-binding protein